jgi:hypothetical protein
MRIAALCMWAIAGRVVLIAQPAFEVASVKPCDVILVQRASRHIRYKALPPPGRVSRQRRTWS